MRSIEVRIPRRNSPRVTAAHGSARHDKGSWAGGGQAGTRADAAWPGAVFVMRPGSGGVPSPSATASGSPDHLLRPNPVRYMSVIMEIVERTTAYRGGLRCWLERAADICPDGAFSQVSIV